MHQILETILAEFKRQVHDGRENVFEVNPTSIESGHVRLEGRVLHPETLDRLSAAVRARLPQIDLDLSGVKVLRRSGAEVLSVGTNLTSMHAGKSFISELVTQCLYGAQLEVLEQSGLWIYARQLDGYLGWTYRPYLTTARLPEPTHLIVAPAVEVRSGPSAGAPVLTRLFSGTPVFTERTLAGWVEVAANQRGWVPEAAVRAIQALPGAGDQRRELMMQDAARMVGVPYLWGGCTGNGIDCSGLAQLLHRWVGIPLRRDADMQHDDGRPVEPPFSPGDLLFFGEKGETRRITHVGISIGGWEMVHSSRSRNGVYYDNVQQIPHLKDSFLGASTYLR